MTIPLGISNNSPGLEYLSRLDQLVVHQKVQLLEGFVGYESNNKYTVKNNIGQKMFYAVEDNDCCSRTFCGNRRPFDMKIMNSSRNEVRLILFISMKHATLPYGPLVSVIYESSK